MRKKIIGLLISILFLVEYGGVAFIAVYGYLHINYKDIYVGTSQFLIAALLVDAVICLFVAAITGLYIHKKLGIINRKALIYFSISALLSLPASLLLPTVLLPTVSVSFLNGLSNNFFARLIFGWFFVAVIVISYLLGIVLPNAICIRMARKLQDNPEKEPSFS